MKFRHRVPVFVVCAIALAPVRALTAQDRVVEIETRNGVTQSFVVVEPPTAPVASVILFAGGVGKLGIKSEGIRRAKNNFLVRTRCLFAGHGFLTAVVDAPSDRQSRQGLRGFRTTRAHAQDIAAVIAYLRKQADAPVWLIGTSRGTISAANGAARLKPGGPEGIVLTATVTRAGKRWSDSVRDVDLAAVRAPVLLVHHVDDGCYVTPYEDMPRLMRSLKNAPKKELLSFKGGKEAESDACQARSEHGFFGLEKKVVKAIAQWIRGVNRGR